MTTSQSSENSRVSDGTLRTDRTQSEIDNMIAEGGPVRQEGTAPAPDRNREYEPTNDRRPNDARKRPYFDSCTLNDGGVMPRPIAAIRECARLWREEQARAIDSGDAARAAHAEKCAQRFDEYWRRNSPESLGARTP